MITRQLRRMDCAAHLEAKDIVPISVFPDLSVGSMLDIVYRDTVCAARPRGAGRCRAPLAGIPLHSIDPENQKIP
jgi:hypothetical protein